MIFRELLANQLTEKKNDFTEFSDAQRDSLEIYLSKIKRLEQTSVEEIQKRFELKDETGAMPSVELSKYKTFAIPFPQIWNNHEESRKWAYEILQNRTTFAVDGSQIPPTRDVSMTVAAVQVGWFENPHSESARYEKNAEFFILSPSDLMPSPEEARVNERRIQEEVRKTREFLEKKRGWKERGERLPLAFYDNTLLVPFPLSPKGASNYIELMQNLILLSDQTQVPLVGYVARSYAKDLLTFLDEFDSESTDARLLHDADILFPRVLQFWGDRTCFCYAKRTGLTEVFGDTVGFVYLQTTSNATPARVDIPSWIVENGLLNEVLDVIRAECIIGLGYPYALETADQTAVITTQDREMFYRALQDFAKEHNLNFTVSRKAASKGRRR
ncbi:MAG TPA: DNA double-strand break repair nuclease NurA [Pyrinomonadaceae bacterium]|nr:DNA double-strand break repair nuclease NurA [Pyrinomonadaceae bacterium]